MFSWPLRDESQIIQARKENKQSMSTRDAEEVSCFLLVTLTGLKIFD